MAEIQYNQYNFFSSIPEVLIDNEAVSYAVASIWVPSMGKLMMRLANEEDMQVWSVPEIVKIRDEIAKISMSELLDVLKIGQRPPYLVVGASIVAERFSERLCEMSKSVELILNSKLDTDPSANTKH